MADRQAKGGDTQTGPPATHTARGAREEGDTRGEVRAGTGPNPPDLPRALRTHDQGSSTAKRYAPAPWLGTLRASSRGSHWRQASSTGPAAPTPRTTKHQSGRHGG